MPEDNVLFEEGMDEIDTVTLTSEDGTEKEFEVLDALEYEDSEYYALTPLYDADPEKLLEDAGELIILRSTVDDDGEQYLEEIEDDDEYEAVSALFTERLESEYDIEE